MKSRIEITPEAVEKYYNLIVRENIEYLLLEGIYEKEYITQKLNITLAIMFAYFDFLGYEPVQNLPLPLKGYTSFLFLEKFNIFELWREEGYWVDWFLQKSRKLYKKLGGTGKWRHLMGIEEDKYIEYHRQYNFNTLKKDLWGE